METFTRRTLGKYVLGSLASATLLNSQDAPIGSVWNPTQTLVNAANVQAANLLSHTLPIINSGNINDPINLAGIYPSFSMMLYFLRIMGLDPLTFTAFNTDFPPLTNDDFNQAIAAAQARGFTGDTTLLSNAMIQSDNARSDVWGEIITAEFYNNMVSVYYALAQNTFAAPQKRVMFRCKDCPPSQPPPAPPIFIWPINPLPPGVIVPPSVIEEYKTVPHKLTKEQFCYYFDKVNGFCGFVGSLMFLPKRYSLIAKAVVSWPLDEIAVAMLILSAVGFVVDNTYCNPHG